MIGPTSGTGSICGVDILEDMNKVREYIGFLPQFDILWDELTAKEHLIMFARLKGIEKSEIKSLVSEILKEVNLEDVGNSLVRTFSGGIQLYED